MAADSDHVDEGSLAGGGRRCIACGYSLIGLGDSPRCPECGLLNIPEGLRRQVWDLVDAGPWFFSSFFNPFAKRLPGWWWALDRPGDVGRSFRFVGKHALVAFLLIFTAISLDDLIQVETTVRYSLTDPNDPTFREDLGEWVSVRGALGVRHISESNVNWNPLRGTNLRWTTATTWNVLYQFSWSGMAIGLSVFVWALLAWACPALAGIWTQIRKGLPDFARAPRTIIAASNYEAHRLTYLAMVIVIAAAADAAVRIALAPSTPWALRSSEALVAMLTGLVLLAAMCGWIGPLRSDYTKQLIRSWFHALRIVLMYALFLPPLLAVAIIGVIEAVLEAAGASG